MRVNSHRAAPDVMGADHASPAGTITPHPALTGDPAGSETPEAGSGTAAG
jgi:hypothetical protein